MRPNCGQSGGGSSQLTDAMLGLKATTTSCPSKLNDDLPRSARFDKGVRGTNLPNGETLLVEKRPQSGSRPAFAGNQEEGG